MNAVAEQIQKAIDAGRIKNAADLAKLLHVQRSTVSMWMNGKKAPSAEDARKLAEVLGTPAGMLMAECEALRAKDEATRAEWQRVARLCSGPTAAVKTGALMALLAVTLFVTGAENTQANQANARARLDNLHIMALRRFLAGLAKARGLAHGAHRSWRAALALAGSRDRRAPA